MLQASREVHLVARPSGTPVPGDFRVVDVVMPEPGPGQILVRNQFMSVDPYMRGRMDDVPTDLMPTFPLNVAMEGHAVGEVIASRAEGIVAGQHVVHWHGWREHAVLDGREVEVVDADATTSSSFLGVLGHTGFSAYVGLLDIGGLRDGDVVFVSAAAGAVGSVAGQIAKLLGHTVIGSAGSPAKVAYLLDDLGFDAAFDYHRGPARELLHDAAPDGIDLYFDNVGGEQLEAALDVLRLHGRVAACGAISTYNTVGRSSGPRNLFRVINSRLTMRGFSIADHADRRPAFARDMSRWLAEGKLKGAETIVEGGIEAAPGAFLSMLEGANVGKTIVRLEASVA